MYRHNKQDFLNTFYVHSVHRHFGGPYHELSAAAQQLTLQGKLPGLTSLKGLFPCLGTRLYPASCADVLQWGSSLTSFSNIRYKYDIAADISEDNAKDLKYCPKNEPFLYLEIIITNHAKPNIGFSLDHRKQNILCSLQFCV